MRNELQHQLEKDFPFMRQYQFCDCGDGWYELIHNLCWAITERYEQDGKNVDLVATQIKQKYATLRFYYEYEEDSTDEKTVQLRNDICDIVQAYEEKSEGICEDCGAAGEWCTLDDWQMILCDSCYKKRRMDKVNEYFIHMNLHHGKIDYRVGSLCKIFHKAIDRSSYTMEEKITMLKMLIADIDEMKAQGEYVYATLDACYCYKINKILGAGLDIPVEKSDDLIIATPCMTKEIPWVIRKYMETISSSTLRFAEIITPDEEILELFNVQIAQVLFYYSH